VVQVTVTPSLEERDDMVDLEIRGPVEPALLVAPSPLMLATVTVRTATPVLPAASRAETVRVLEPGRSAIGAGGPGRSAGGNAAAPLAVCPGDLGHADVVRGSAAQSQSGTAGGKSRTGSGRCDGHRGRRRIRCGGGAGLAASAEQGAREGNAARC